MKSTSRWVCAQMGAREHYAVPRALDSVRALHLLLTDYWSGPSTRALARYVNSVPLQSMAARHHCGISSKRIRSFNLQALAKEFGSWWRTRDGNVATTYLNYCDSGRWFAKSVVNALQTNSTLGSSDVFIGYNTSCLETIQYLKDRHVHCIVDQIDPCRTEAMAVKAEQCAWRGWEDEVLDIPEAFFERIEKEWYLADQIVVNSRWSQKALVAQGVAPEKIRIVPLSFEAPCQDPNGESESLARLIESRYGLRHAFSSQHPMRVLFLGQVSLRKGVQYLLEAARSLRQDPVHFDIVGPVHISPMAMASAPSNVAFHGRTLRGETAQWYRAAHVFVLPTISDGFAITQIEAMSNGLPVIATENCGEVVSDCIDGFVVPPRDSNALVRALQNYLDCPDMCAKHSAAAVDKSKQFSLQRLASDLLALNATR